MTYNELVDAMTQWVLDGLDWKDMSAMCYDIIESNLRDMTMVDLVNEAKENGLMDEDEELE